MKNEMKDVLKDCIEDVANLFQDNELAFLALQGKIELQLRDKIAWLLYKKGYYNVKKEYAPRVEDIGRKKCDLAILDDDLKPICMVEFKAHSSAKWESHYKKCFEEDLDKMRQMTQQGQFKDVQLFYIFFQTVHTRTFETERDTTLVPYCDVINSGVIHHAETTLKKQWEDMCSREDSPELISSVVIEAGEYLEDTVTIHAMIFGPTK